MRILLASALLAVATPVMADETTGTVLAFDRVAGIVVLTDKTVYSLELLGEVPVENLVAGDMVTIDFESIGEDGIDKINAITRAGE
ncbi:hypothetical protein [Marimonas arenosa]|uniref:DUF1344 domain-containing protein n=1 Tax=Marimonas arenosa TaxID=1795305 RepID=A0AAE3WFC2_9RHOB|nr:hypothetical protein [Marimonas arenosa]MDQ2091659.1 hypothetical protein [Marimonas arenosa]